MRTGLGFDREQVRAWIEDATGVGLSVGDALPDTLIATAEALGLTPRELRLWIFDHSRVTPTGEAATAEVSTATWTGAALAKWAWRHGLARDGSDPL